MKISTKGRYGLRLMLDLAVCGGASGVPVSLRDAARRQELSDKYLEQIAGQLGRAGLLRSVRGAGGGYLLARPAKDYTVGEILRVMEGEMLPVDCTGGGCCHQIDHCVTLEVWQSIAQAVDGVVDNITLEELVHRYHQKSEGKEST